MATAKPIGSGRRRLLYVYKIFLEETDENHYLTREEIVTILARYGVSAERRAIYEDVNALQSFGLDIVEDHSGGNCHYALVSRDFELAELKLLADAVSSSQFLTEKKSAELLKKIESLCSRYEAEQIRRQVFVANRLKSDNERILLSVDTIHRAMSENRQISFRYFSYDVKKNRVYREGLRQCSPYALVWQDERYYLLGYYEKRQGITNFRVDRMEGVTVCDEARLPQPEGFSVAKYINASFSMFSGEVSKVELRAENELVNAVFDRFGTDIIVCPDGEEHFTVSVDVKAEQPEPFFGWIFQFGSRVRIISPSWLAERYKEFVKEVLSGLE